MLSLYFRPMPIKNGHGRRHVIAFKMGKLPILNLHGSNKTQRVLLNLSLTFTTEWTDRPF
jgi:hypothetical protein